MWVIPETSQFYRFVQDTEMKILNLYAGIGGNRKLWGNDHQVTAIELNPNIAEAYSDFFPNDNTIVADAHDYLLRHYDGFDFIWSSPPCPSHSRARYGFGVYGHGYKYIYPDMAMYQEIILLTHRCHNAKWVIENVLPYYNYLIEPSRVLGRHVYWSNFVIQPKVFSKNGMIAGNTKPPATPLSSYRVTGEKAYLEQVTGFDLDRYTGFDKRKSLRNCVEPEAGLHILECATKGNRAVKEQGELF